MAAPWSESALLAAAGLVAAVGVAANTALLAALCAGGGARLRNRLHLHACGADLLVSAVSAPLAAWESRWEAADAEPPTTFVRQAIAFAQAIPVAASTMLLALLAMDRYAAVRLPRLYTAWRRLPGPVAIGAWVLATASAAPLMLVLPPPPSWLVLTRVAVVHALPCVAVAACHAAVCSTLGRASLLAAAARGEVPLPMPLLCRPRHVIIVASVANDAPSKVIPFVRGDALCRREADSDSDGDSIACRIQADLADLQHRQSTTRCNMSSTTRRHHKLAGRRPTDGPRSAARHPLRPPPLLARPQSLRSRRRLARMLAAQLALFAGCWLPHAAAAAAAALGAHAAGTVARRLLLLGHAHSAAAPLLYWALNRRALACAQWGSLVSARIRGHQEQPPPSSTNEAALGPFHPRYITPRIQPRCETSHFLR